MKTYRIFKSVDPRWKRWGLSKGTGNTEWFQSHSRNGDGIETTAVMLLSSAGYEVMRESPGVTPGKSKKKKAI
jgi:hypothetical protein